MGAGPASSMPWRIFSIPMARPFHALRASIQKERRGGDSNPRYDCSHTGFRNQPDQPLRHLSKATGPRPPPATVSHSTRRASGVNSDSAADGPEAGRDVRPRGRVTLPSASDPPRVDLLDGRQFLVRGGQIPVPEHQHAKERDREYHQGNREASPRVDNELHGQEEKRDLP